MQGSKDSREPEGAQPGSTPQDAAAGLATMAHVPGATHWVDQSAVFSLWRGEVPAPDRLRIEGRDGRVHELRLEPVGTLRLGRVPRVDGEVNELVFPDVASRLAVVLRHDGVRWYLQRRPQCSVPVQVGARALEKGEEAALVHGTFVGVGAMRATFVDRRYMAPTVPAGAVDPGTGLLARTGLEQEVAAALLRGPVWLAILRVIEAAASHDAAGSPVEVHEARERIALAAAGAHRSEPSLPIAVEGATVVIVCGPSHDAAKVAERAARVATAAAGVTVLAGCWQVEGAAASTAREVELALLAARTLDASPQRISCAGDPSSLRAVDLRESVDATRLSTPADLAASARDPKRAAILFGIEEQSALSRAGASVVEALERELTALVVSRAGAAAAVAALAPGVVGATISRKGDPHAMSQALLAEWHARPPVMDGKVELPRSLSYEVVPGETLATRAAELSRECADPHGVLSALSAALPYPIAGRVRAATTAASSMERVKMLFDVLEGAWRFIATTLAAAYFAKRGPNGENPAGYEQMADFYKRVGTRDGYALGTWRELARLAARGFEDRTDPVGALARDVLEVRLAENQTFETLSNLLHAERNSFAHGHYTEARAAKDLPEFEQMTRAFLRALRPLGAWSLVTVEKTEPDLYGEAQTVEFIDHTGASQQGTRRRIGLNSPIRLANVTYLARWREGLLVPLEPLVRRISHRESFELFFMDHMPRAGSCMMSLAVGGTSIKVPCDVRRLPPVLRALASGT